MTNSHNFHSTAVENTILNLFVASEKNYEYPSLQKEAVGIIAENLSEVIYDSLKNKSISSSSKRCNLLKFLNNICQTSEFHLDPNHYKIYIKAYSKEYSQVNTPEIENLLQDISQELGKCTNLKKDVVDFYKRKNAKRKEMIKSLEFIKQNDQEKIDMIPGIHVSRNLSHYETSENLINDLLEESSHELKAEDRNVLQDSAKYREEQVKFCYALINLGDKEDMKLLENLLHKLSRYKNMERFEIEFLMDLWLSYDQTNINLDEIITEKFVFIIEKIIIQFCTEIVKLKSTSEVSKYFTDLETNLKIVRLRKACAHSYGLYCKLKCLIFELYILSYCNVNVYRFIDCII